MEPTFDKRGYPTEETLEVIQSWGMRDIEGLVRFIAEAWDKNYGSVEETYPGVWTFATGGWSGNEDIIFVLTANKGYCFLSWQTIGLAGGLFIFAVNGKREKKLNELKSIIRKWAWNRK